MYRPPYEATTVDVLFIRVHSRLAYSSSHRGY